MAESTDYKTFKKNVPIGHDRIDRVENGVGTGIPDINYCIFGKEGWIEQKSPVEPKRSSTPLFGSNHKVSQDQKNWFLRQRQALGRSYFLICTDKRWMLVSGDYAETLNYMTVNELLEVASWTTLKPVKDKTQWTHLRRALSR